MGAKHLELDQSRKILGVGNGFIPTSARWNTYYNYEEIWGLLGENRYFYNMLFLENHGRLGGTQYEYERARLAEMSCHAKKGESQGHGG